MALKLEAFFDNKSFTLTYLVFDEESKHALVIDPVLDFDIVTGEFSLDSLKKIEQTLIKKQLSLKLILETHAHADHLSGAIQLSKRQGAIQIGIGKKICEVQKIFGDLFHFSNFKHDGSQFHQLFEDGQTAWAGTIQFKVISTPGHTPACVSYLVGDWLFTGDALFMPDFGTGRCDFPGGSAQDLYHSISKKIYSLPDKTKIYVGHDYQPGGRELRYQSTIQEQKSINKHLNDQTTQEEFVEFRTLRDQKLSPPKLLLPSIQVNIRAGDLPENEENGTSYLKIPVKQRVEKL